MEGASSISVVVRLRPFSQKELQLQPNPSSSSTNPTLFNSDSTTSTTSISSTFTTPQPPRHAAGAIRKVLKVLDDRILVFDPPENTAVTSFKGLNLPPVLGKKVKDIRFCFDRVFDEGCGQEEVYEGSAKELVGHVMNGFHSTVFAYGATGCGKTHTISGSPTQPGVVFLIMKDLFARISAKSHDTDFSLTVSYLEIYNETIRDLLCPESGPLALRENNGIAAPAGLSTKEPTSANDVVEWIMLGNANRTVNATEANATSSRSHAVLSVTVSQKPRAGGLTENHSSASLSVIDLAGSERASVTKNKGERLIEGANINRSLLALGNCINALCDPRKRGHVPYRDSKLTRLLKQSLGGNCKTVMIVCVSPSSQHYDETHNTLQYANRAKEIKTKAIRNVVTVDRHVQDYCRAIAKLQQQVAEGEALYESRAASARIAAIEVERMEVESAVRKVRGPWENVYRASIKSERSRVERAGIEGVIAVLQRWKGTAFSNLDSSASPNSTLSSTQSACDALISSLTISLQATSSPSATSSIDLYSTIRTSLASKLRSSTLATFNLETKVLDLQLDAARSKAREEGLLEASKVQARAMSAMCEARARVAAAVEFERGQDEEADQVLKKLAEGIDHANREAFVALSNGSHIALAMPSSSTGHKRNVGTRSPPLADTPSLPKSSRGAIAGFGSSATGSLASPMRQPSVGSTSFSRRSPKKHVIFPSSRINPIIRNSPKKKKGLGVSWRDEAGQGWELEDVRQASVSPDSTMDVSMTSTPSHPFASTSTPSSAIISMAPPTFSAAEMLAAHKRSAMGPLLRKPLGAQRSLTTLSESSVPFTFFQADPYNSMPPPPLRSVSSSSTRSPLTDSGNTTLSETSFSMALTPSGLYAPFVAAPKSSSSSSISSHSMIPASAQKARRVSTIGGPTRSTKLNRRISDLSSSSTIPSSVRKPRIGTGFSAIASAKKSPRKLSSSVSLSSKRNSIPPTFMTTAPPGSRSDARLLARRESNMGGTSGIAKNTMARESLGGAAAVWR